MVTAGFFQGSGSDSSRQDREASAAGERVQGEASGGRRESRAAWQTESRRGGVAHGRACELQYASSPWGA